MRIYQSSINKKILTELYSLSPETKVNILRSFKTDGPGTLDLLDAKIPNINSFMLDSGVYAANQGTIKQESNVKIYGNFCLRHGHRFEYYANYDREFGNEGFATNWKNQLYLESIGLTPFPVVHNISNDEVEQYVNMKDKYKFIAIGSTRLKKEDDVIKTANYLYDQGFKVHIFGYGSFNRLKDCKAFSTDCSSFARWTSVGRVIYFSKSLGKEIQFSFLPYDKDGSPSEDYIYNHKEDVSNLILNDYQDFIGENLNLSVEDLFTDSDKRTLANSFYFCQLEKDITEIQKNNGVVYDKW